MTSSASKHSHSYSKPCTLCSQPRDVLVRCQIDESGQWHFVCPGLCWKRASGGVTDGDAAEEHKWYRYGGMWKNKHEAVSAKKPKKKQHAAPSRGNVSDSAVRVEHDDDPGDKMALENNEDPAVEQTQPTSTTGIPVWREDKTKYAKNDKVIYCNDVWICRKSHVSVEGGRPPDKAQSLWKEQKGYVEDPD